MSAASENKDFERSFHRSMKAIEKPHAALRFVAVEVGARHVDAAHRYASGDNGAARSIEIRDAGGVVATVELGGLSGYSRIAAIKKAELLAFAPELYDALKLLLEAAEVSDCASGPVMYAREVIKAVRGQA